MKNRTGGPPDPLWIDVVVAIVRYAPGAVLGAAIGFREAADLRIENPWYFAAAILGPAALLGLVSGTLGLAFWEGIRDSRWWRWF